MSVSDAVPIANGSTRNKNIFSCLVLCLPTVSTRCKAPSGFTKFLVRNAPARRRQDEMKVGRTLLVNVDGKSLRHLEPGDILNRAPRIFEKLGTERFVLVCSCSELSLNFNCSLHDLSAFD